jgi:adenylate kinase family enzyme
VRVAIHGTSGAGKTRVARAIAERISAPMLELDALRHQPDWTEVEDGAFRASVAAFIAGEEWIVDGNYDVVRDLVDDRATHVVWLDLPRWLIMRQVSVRTAGRLMRRRELWNGNREHLGDLLESTHPIRWAWSTFHERRRRYEQEMDERWIRLRSRREVASWVEHLSSEPRDE